MITEAEARAQQLRLLAQLAQPATAPATTTSQATAHSAPSPDTPLPPNILLTPHPSHTTFSPFTSPELATTTAAAAAMAAAIDLPVMPSAFSPTTAAAGAHVAVTLAAGGRVQAHGGVTAPGAGARQLVASQAQVVTAAIVQPFMQQSLPASPHTTHSAHGPGRSSTMPAAVSVAAAAAGPVVPHMMAWLPGGSVHASPLRMAVVATSSPAVAAAQSGSGAAYHHTADDVAVLAGGSAAVGQWPHALPHTCPH